jgi:hypothetical protein
MIRMFEHFDDPAPPHGDRVGVGGPAWRLRVRRNGILAGVGAVALALVLVAAALTAPAGGPRKVVLPRPAATLPPLPTPDITVPETLPTIVVPGVRPSLPAMRRPTARVAARTTTTTAPVVLNYDVCRTKAQLEQRANSKPRRVTVTQPQDVEGGHIDPPPPGAKPTTSAEEAWRTAVGDPPVNDPGPDPTIALVLFTEGDGNRYAYNADQSPAYRIDHRLAWWILERAAVTGPFSNPPSWAAGSTRRPSCYLGDRWAFVDSPTGRVDFSGDSGKDVY